MEDVSWLCSHPLILVIFILVATTVLIKLPFDIIFEEGEDHWDPDPS